MKNLGQRHPTLTLALVPELLAIHPMFETPEPNVEEPSCILLNCQIYYLLCFKFEIINNQTCPLTNKTDVSILILVFNAASKCNSIISLLEDKTVKHYSYLRDIMPHLVPSLQVL